MSATYAPPARAGRTHVTLWLVAVIGLTAALVALGTWVIVDRYLGSGGAAGDATTLIDDFNAGVSAGDGQAVAALLTNDAVLRLFGDTFTADEFVAAATPVPSERLAAVTVEGDFATTFVRNSVIADPFIAVFQLKDGRIFRVWSLELGSTPPFDNAVVP